MADNEELASIRKKRVEMEAKLDEQEARVRRLKAELELMQRLIKRETQN
jgi:hypothetical protein